MLEPPKSVLSTFHGICLLHSAPVAGVRDFLLSPRKTTAAPKTCTRFVTFDREV